VPLSWAFKVPQVLRACRFAPGGEDFDEAVGMPLEWTAGGASGGQDFDKAAGTSLKSTAEGEMVLPCGQA
jgi:hypothetical protein